MKEIIKYKISEINTIMPQVWTLIKDNSTIALHGDLGAGKTTFTSALCSFLKTEEKASSPTFSLINEYHFKDENGAAKTIYHSDWYRIKDEEEAINAGIEDMLLQKDAYFIIEWSEKAPNLLSENTIHIYFIIEDEQTRILEIA